MIRFSLLRHVHQYRTCSEDGVEALSQNHLLMRVESLSLVFSGALEQDTKNLIIVLSEASSSCVINRSAKVTTGTSIYFSS